MRKVLVAAILAAEGLFLLSPNGALVHAAGGSRRSESEAESWWRKSPVHMGCSVASCSRPATRTVSYRLPGARGNTWRAYGFCDQHQPPAAVTGLVYRQGRPAVALAYDVPLAPVWAEVYFLLGTVLFGLWCAGMWRLAGSMARPLSWIPFCLLHAGILAGLWFV